MEDNSMPNNEIRTAKTTFGSLVFADLYIPVHWIIFFRVSHLSMVLPASWMLLRV